MALDALVIRKGSLELHSDLPVALYAGTGDDPRPRLRVDPGDTGFFEGRHFRVFHEFTVGAGLSTFIRFTVPAQQDVIVHRRDITVIEGSMRFALSTGGVEAGVWTPKQVFLVNAMQERPQPYYTNAVLSDTGGSVSGGLERDIVLLATPNAAGQAVTASLGEPEVGLPTSVYYVELRNIGSGNCRGVYKVVWEERAAQSPELY